MIRSFGDKDTRRIWDRSEQVKRFASVERVAYRVLTRLNAAEKLSDLKSPGFHLEALTKERAIIGYHSIRVSDKYRVIFRWVDGHVQPPVHPGEILLEDIMKPLALSANRLAFELGIPTSRVLEIVHGRRSVSADTAVRLGRYLGTTAQFWMNLQSQYDLLTAMDAIGATVEREVTPRAMTEEQMATR